MKLRFHLLPAALAMLAVAAPSSAQEPDSTKASVPAAAPAAPATPAAGMTAREFAEAHRDVLDPVAGELARYHKTRAQLDRIERVAREEKKTDMKEKVLRLRERNEQTHRERMEQLRKAHGEARVAEAVKFIEEHRKGRVGKGSAAQQAMKEKAKNESGEGFKEKAKNRQEKSEKAKEKVKNSKDKPEAEGQQ